MNTQPIADELYNTTDAAEILGVTPRQVRYLIDDSILPAKHVNTGKKIYHFITGQALIDYMAEREEDEQPLPFESADMDRLIRRVDALSELVKGLADAIIMLCKEEEAEAAAGKKFFANLGDGLARLEKMEE